MTRRPRLTLTEKEVIKQLFDLGVSRSEIKRITGRSDATISRLGNAEEPIVPVEIEEPTADSIRQQIRDLMTEKNGVNAELDGKINERAAMNIVIDGLIAKKREINRQLNDLYDRLAELEEA